MSLFRKNSAGSSEKTNPLYLLIAALIMPVIELGKWCTDKVYSGWKGGFLCLFALAASISSSIGAGQYVHTAWHFGMFWTVIAGIIAWLGVMFYIFPLTWRFIAKPVWDLCDAIYDRVREITRKYAKPVFGAVVKAAVTVCVGSGKLWQRLQSDDFERSWFPKLVGAVSYISAFCGSAYLGWTAYGAVFGLVGIPVVSYILAVTAGLLTFGVVFGLIEQCITFGDYPFIGIVASAAAAWAGAPAISAALGVSGALSYGVLAVSFVLALGYVFPLVNLAFTNGFWARVWKVVKQLPDKTYDDKNKDYARFFQHVVNFLVTAGVTGGACFIASTASVPLWGIVPIALVVAGLTYIVGFKIVGWEGGTFLIGSALSLGAAYEVGCMYVANGFVYGVYGAIVAGVLGALVTGVVLFPLAYLLVRAVLNAMGASSLAAPLTAMYKAADTQFKKALKELRYSFDYCYRDKPGYNELVLHIVNIGIAYAACKGTLALVAGVGAATGILGWVAILLATGLSYLLVGKLLFKSGYGLEFVGGCLSLAAAVYVGNVVYGVAPGNLMMVAAGATGIATWFGVFFIAVPVAYVVAKFLTSWALTGWLKPLLGWIYDHAWDLFVGFWKGFLATYNYLWELTAPVRAAIGRAWAGIAEQYRKILAAIRGR